MTGLAAMTRWFGVRRKLLGVIDQNLAQTTIAAAQDWN
jgi:hypothetical protein